MKTNWRELISKQELSIPFEVVHIDSHADMGLRGLGIIPNKHFYVLAECQNVKNLASGRTDAMLAVLQIVEKTFFYRMNFLKYKTIYGTIFKYVDRTR